MEEKLADNENILYQLQDFRLTSHLWQSSNHFEPSKSTTELIHQFP